MRRVMAVLIAMSLSCNCGAPQNGGTGGGGAVGGGAGGGGSGGSAGGGSGGGTGGNACPNMIPEVPAGPGLASGAVRGCSSCDAPHPQCSAQSEYIVSVSCHPDSDGGRLAVNGIAGQWCYPSPPACGDTP